MNKIVIKTILYIAGVVILIGQFYQFSVYRNIFPTLINTNYKVDLYQGVVREQGSKELEKLVLETLIPEEVNSVSPVFNDVILSIKDVEIKNSSNKKIEVDEINAGTMIKVMLRSDNLLEEEYMSTTQIEAENILKIVTIDKKSIFIKSQIKRKYLYEYYLP